MNLLPSLAFQCIKFVFEDDKLFASRGDDVEPAFDRLHVRLEIGLESSISRKGNLNLCELIDSLLACVARQKCLFRCRQFL